MLLLNLLLTVAPHAILILLTNEDFLQQFFYINVLTVLQVVCVEVEDFVLFHALDQVAELMLEAGVVEQGEGDGLAQEHARHGLREASSNKPAVRLLL